ncbi:hypothetical protein [Sphaerisporangium fuscum]|uniref:hypothetical protein n=1 Tax=Sphaerisporangium fuscum TaxID=2835868 RepID=UPI001BDC3BEF|nr:hypothetical protein [Sphaerisporangium fuscum]
MGWVRRNAGGTFLAGVLLVSFPVLLLAALQPAPVVFAVAAGVSYGVEAAAGRLARPALHRLGRLYLGVTARFLAREVSAVLLVARTAGAGSRWFVVLCAGFLVMYALRVLQAGTALHLDRCLNRMPVVTRNVDVSALRIPAGPPGGPVAWRGAGLFYLDVLPVGAIALGTGTPYAAYAGGAGLGAAIALQAAVVLLLLYHVWRAAPLASRRRVIAEVDRQVAAHRPEVIFYFSGGPASVYQATMWLGTLERVARRTIVVLREREVFSLLGPTTLPVVCVPSAVDLMNMRGLESARLALYASNVGKNIHLLRVPGLRSVFIGHGDSDKEASFNPFSKVYDEVWVAGQAGRDRYLRARVGVRDEDIVEVGRPQLSGILETGPGLPLLSVLYAPTWEGWTDDLFHTSLATMGPKLVDALLRQVPAVRVIYKPHPLTGERDPRAGAAHREIVEMITAAGAAPGPWPWPAPALADGADGLAFEPAPALVHHMVVTGSEPHLYDCFNDCDLLIGDISSVVADFVASGKPYAVTNVAGMEDGAFRDRYPSAEAAYLLGPDLAELPDILAQARRAEGDDLAEARRKMKTYLLGPGHPDAMTRFNDAVNRAHDMAYLGGAMRL